MGRLTCIHVHLLTISVLAIVSKFRHVGMILDALLKLLFIKWKLNIARYIYGIFFIIYYISVCEILWHISTVDQIYTDLQHVT